jgi:hypothetical protein
MNKAGSSEQFGFESSVHYVAEPFNITASHSFVDALSYTGQTAGGQTQLPGVAPNVSRLNVVFKPWEKVSLGANYLFYNSWNSPNGTQADGAHLLNASVIYSPWKQLELSASVKNILGENSLYPMLNYLPDIKPGAPALESTTFWLNFRFSFEGKI